MSQQIMVCPPPKHQANFLLQSWQNHPTPPAHTYLSMPDKQAALYHESAKLSRREGVIIVVERGCESGSTSFPHLFILTYLSLVPIATQIAKEERGAWTMWVCVSLDVRLCLLSGLQSFIQPLAQCGLCRKDIRNKKQTGRFRSRQPELLRKTFR